MKNPRLFVLAILVFASGLAQSQPPNQNPVPPGQENVGEKGFWQATLPGGQFVVPLSRIVTVSRHQYVVDSAFIADEVTVDTAGQALARFYYLRPISDKGPGDLAKLVESGREFLDRAGQQAETHNLQDMVVKKYPDTTHARTIEYRLLSEAQLTGLYDSVRKAWISNRGAEYVVK